MERIESIMDDMNGVVTYTLPNGKCVRLDRRYVQDVGLGEALRRMGLADLLPNARVPVVQHGRPIGTLPPDFDPLFIRSTSPWYEPRQGDFHRNGDVWVAANNLGPGDLDAVPGFVRDRR